MNGKSLQALLANWLAQAMQETGKTPTEIARIGGISRATVYRVLKGLPATPRILARVSKAVGRDLPGLTLAPRIDGEAPSSPVAPGSPQEAQLALVEALERYVREVSDRTGNRPSAYELIGFLRDWLLTDATLRAP